MMRNLIDPGGYYPPGFDGYLPGERPSTATYDDNDAICNCCGRPFFFPADRRYATTCDDCWDDEIDADGGEE